MTNQHGETVTLRSYRGRRVLVFFYPKAEHARLHPAGVRPARHRRPGGRHGDHRHQPRQAPAAQKKFDDKYALGYPLLADTEHAVAEAYGVWQEKKNYGKKYMGIDALGVPRRRRRQDRAGLVQDQPEGHAR